MDSTVTVTIHELTRLKNSINGNPRYTAHTDKGDYTTIRDGQVGHLLANSEYMNVPVRLLLDGRGVYGIEIEGSQR